MPRQSKYKTKDTLNSESMYKAALYIRLSVEDGDKEESNSVTNQRMLLTEFLKGTITLFTDSGFFILSIWSFIAINLMLKRGKTFSI